MLEHICILNHGGFVLWERSFGQPRRAAINELIREVLLEDRAGDREYVVEKLKLKWSFENQNQFIVIAVYQKFLQLVHIDKFLSTLRTTFLDKFSTELNNQSTALGLGSLDFDDEFNELFADFTSTERKAKAAGETYESVTAAEGDGVDKDAGDAATPTSPNADSKKTLPTKGSKKNLKKGDPSSPTGSPGGKKKGKVARDWNATEGRFVDEKAAASVADNELTPEEKEAYLNAQAEKNRKTLIKHDEKGKVVPMSEKDWGKPKRGFVATWLRSHFGARELDKEDMENILPKLEEKLINKNVAVEVAELVCKSVGTQIQGKKLSTFDSLQETIEDAMTNALRRILQPKREVNILRDVATAVSRRRPYSIVFCGVNGVGKSTTLSKITYWLQQNGHSILLAAGDTFRHGAVEQLEVHGRCLDVPVLQMGYGADPSHVATAAIQQASKNGTHCVLIDTAGRMQDHESRMRALAKLIHDNTPDLVLFVGEAVVGNNVVDQLRKFNQCLQDFAPANAKPRGIDGLVLTKFDTIDDKVGASVSMVYELGQPIVFVGVGQTYQDLKTIEPETVVSALMS